MDPQPCLDSRSSKEELEGELLNLHKEVLQNWAEFDINLDMKCQLLALKSKLEDPNQVARQLPGKHGDEPSDSLVTHSIEDPTIDSKSDGRVAQSGPLKRSYFANTVSRWLDRLDLINSLLHSKDRQGRYSDCAICLSPIDKPLDGVCYCSEPLEPSKCTSPPSVVSVDNQHVKYHKSCLDEYIVTTISSGFMGSCPRIYCPEISHVNSRGPKKVLMPYRKWSNSVSEALLKQYRTMAEGFMIFLCGSCHNSRSTLINYDASAEVNLIKYTSIANPVCVRCINGHPLVPFNDNSHGWICEGRNEPGGCNLGPALDFSGLPGFLCERCALYYCNSCHMSKSQKLEQIRNEGEAAALTNSMEVHEPSMSANMRPPLIRDVSALLSSLKKFELGMIDVKSFYLELRTIHFPEFNSKTDLEAWNFFKIILSSISDPERRAALQLHHLIERPRFITECCKKEHCFKCKTKDFHEGKTCAENIGKHESSALPCPNCGIFLTKSDGCDSISCVCNHKFAWKQEMLLYNHVNKFAADYPNDTGRWCADVLCGLVKGVSHLNAFHWRGHGENIALVDKHILSSLKKRFPNIANHMMAKCIVDSTLQERWNVHSTAISAWMAVYKKQVDHAVNQINVSKSSAIDSIYPTLSDKYIALSSFAFTSIDQLSSSDKELHSSLLKFKSKNHDAWSNVADSHTINSAKQFLRLFGSDSITTVYELPNLASAEISHDHFWANEWCDNSLEMSADRLEVMRLGGLSSYPAAFSKINSTQDNLKVRLIAAGTMTNSISFGISLLHTNLENSLVPSLNRSGSDGVGRTSSTYGLIEDRGSSHPAKIYTNGNLLHSWRKLRVGDILSAAIDLDALTCTISLNDEYSETFDIVPGSYCFAMTFANDHKVRILNSDDCRFDFPALSNASTKAPPPDTLLHSNVSGANSVESVAGSGEKGSAYNTNEIANPTRDSKVKILNNFHFRLFLDFLRVLRIINSLESLNEENKYCSSYIFKDLVANCSRNCPPNLNMIGVKEIVDKLTLNKAAASDTIFSPLENSLTWRSLFDAACVVLNEREQRNREMEEMYGFQFYEIWGENAAFEAASILVPDNRSVSKEEIKMAKAFMRVMAFMADDWYDYNASLSESLIPALRKVKKHCRCLPRCIGNYNCPYEM